MLNRVQLVGHLGHAPEIRLTRDGKEMAILSLCTHSSWKKTPRETSLKESSLNEHSLSALSLSEPSLSKSSMRDHSLRASSENPNNEQRCQTTPLWTEWHRVTVFPEAVVNWIKGSLRKGDMLLVEGKLAYAEWEDAPRAPIGSSSGVSSGSPVGSSLGCKSNNTGRIKRRVASIVVSGWGGNVQLIRSQKTPLLKREEGQDAEHNENQESEGDDSPVNEGPLNEGPL